MEDGYMSGNMVMSGLRQPLSLSDGLLTGSGDGYGLAGIMFGSLMNRGAGHLIITEDGPLLPRSVGAGFHRPEEPSTGDQAM